MNEATFLADGISSIAVHNGVARVVFMRLGQDGKPTPSVEICVPVSAIKQVSEAFKKII